MDCSSAKATISATSFHTSTAARDVAVRTAQYLDTDNHPDITFASARAIAPARFEPP